MPKRWVVEGEHGKAISADLVEALTAAAGRATGKRYRVWAGDVTATIYADTGDEAQRLFNLSHGREQGAQVTFQLLA